MRPMLVQYLIGLCCLRNDRNAVDVTIGDMVLDPAADKERDVDITVTIENGTEKAAFKAYEVKHENTPLDVSTIEGLCMKLHDMPAVTHRSIVSSSGYTDGARAKARKHGVNLFTLSPSDTPIEIDFPKFEMVGRPSDVLSTSETLLEWRRWDVRLGVLPPCSNFSIDPGAPIFSANGSGHTEYSTFDSWRSALLLKSTRILFSLDPALSVLNTFPPDLAKPDYYGPQWPHTHTLHTENDAVYLKIDGGLRQITIATINGYLQWHYSRTSPTFYVMRNVETGEPFASALVSLGKEDGEMLVFAIADSPNADVHLVKLERKHLNVIRRLKLEIPTQ